MRKICCQIPYEPFNFGFRYKPREVSSNGDDLALIRLPTLAVTVEEDLSQIVLPGDKNDMQKVMLQKTKRRLAQVASKRPLHNLNIKGSFIMKMDVNNINILQSNLCTTTILEALNLWSLSAAIRCTYVALSYKNYNQDSKMVGAVGSWLLFEGGCYSKVVAIRRWLLFEGGRKLKFDCITFWRGK